MQNAAHWFYLCRPLDDSIVMAESFMCVCVSECPFGSLWFSLSRKTSVVKSIHLNFYINDATEMA